MRRSALAIALLASAPAAAQTQWYPPNGGATAVPLFVQGCLNASNQAVPVSSGTCANNNGASTSTSSTANQGAAGTSPWPVFAGAYYSALPTLTSGNPAYVTLDQNGRLILSPSSSVAVSNFPATQQVAGAVTATTPDARATGTVAAATVGAAYTVATNNQGTARFVVSGLTASGATLQAQYSADGGTTWEAIAILRPPLPYGTTVTADGQYEVKASATTNLRLVVTVAGTGTIGVASDLTNAQGLVGLVGSLPPGTNTIGKFGIDQTTSGTTNGVVVNASALPTGAATAALQSSTQGTVAPGPAAASSTLAGQVYNSAPPAPANGQGLALQSDASGNLKIANATLPPGAATAANQTAGAPVNGTAQAGGVAPLSRLASSAASTNATLAKASPGRVYRIFACNTTTAAVYLKFGNTASAPVPGTTPVFLSRPLPAAGSSGGLNCQAFDVADIGWSFSAGIAYWITTFGADTDATAPAAGAVVQLSVDGA